MKRWGTELFGSFFLGIAIVSFEQNPLAVGCIYAALLFLADLATTGYYNPAVTALLFLKKRIKLNEMLGLMGVQTLGMLGAMSFIIGIFGEPPCPVISPEISVRMAGVMEILLATLFLLVVLRTVKSKEHTLSALIIGVTVVGLASFNGIFNPAVGVASLIATLVHGGGVCVVKDLLMYIGAPFVSALCVWVLDGSRS